MVRDCNVQNMIGCHLVGLRKEEIDMLLDALVALRGDMMTRWANEWTTWGDKTSEVEMKKLALLDGLLNDWKQLASDAFAEACSKQ